MRKGRRSSGRQAVRRGSFWGSLFSFQWGLSVRRPVGREQKLLDVPDGVIEGQLLAVDGVQGLKRDG